MRLFLTTLILAVVLLPNFASAQKLSQLRVAGKNIVNEQGEVVRLHGVSFSDPDKLEKDGQWNERYFKEARDWGCNVVRFAIHPTRLNERGWENYFELVDKGVKLAEEQGMYVIIDWHSIGNLNTEKWTRDIYETSWNETVKFWETVAKRYKGNPTVAVYELFNEPVGGNDLGELTWGTWKPTLEKLIDIIHKIDNEKISLVAGTNWGYFLDEVIENPVDRTNVAYCAHPYPQKRDQPWEPKWEEDWGHVADKYPIIATEFGFVYPDEKGAHIPCISDETYGKAIIDYFNEKGISFTVWCFDPNWSPTLFNDWNFTLSKQGKFFKNALQVMDNNQSAIQQLPSLKGKKVLMVWGGWEGHFPLEHTENILPWLEEQGAIVTVSDSLGVYTNKKIMEETDLIFHSWTMGKISKEQSEGLLKAVKRGVGLAGMHGGLGDSFRENTEYQFMVGGQWVAHPGGVIDHTVEITDTNDPLTKGVNDFKITSEQYYMLVDPNMKVLATTTFNAEHADWIDGAVIPVVWKKTYGKGRVFYIAVGHTPKDFNVPEAWEILTRGIRWASGSKYLPKEEWVSPVYPGKNN